MTHTQEEMAYALGALEAGVTFDWSEGFEKWGAWTRDGLRVIWMEEYRPDDPLRNYAAAGRALGLQPRWRVVDRDVAATAWDVLTQKAYWTQRRKGTEDTNFKHYSRCAQDLSSILSPSPPKEAELYDP